MALPTFEINKNDPPSHVAHVVASIDKAGGGIIQFGQGDIDINLDLSMLGLKPIKLVGQGQDFTRLQSDKGIVLNTQGTDRIVIRDLTINGIDNTGSGGTKCKIGILASRATVDGTLRGASHLYEFVRVEGNYEFAGVWNCCSESWNNIKCDFLNQTADRPAVFITADKDDDPTGFSSDTELAAEFGNVDDLDDGATMTNNNFYGCFFIRFNGNGPNLQIGGGVSTSVFDRCFFSSDGDAAVECVNSSTIFTTRFLYCQLEGQPDSAEAYTAILFSGSADVDASYWTIEGCYFAQDRDGPANSGTGSATSYTNQFDIHGANAYLQYCRIIANRSRGGAIDLDRTYQCEIDHLGAHSTHSGVTNGGNTCTTGLADSLSIDDVIRLYESDTQEWSEHTVTARNRTTNVVTFTPVSPRAYTTGSPVIARRLDIDTKQYTTIVDRWA